MYDLLPILPRKSIRVPASLSAGLQAPRALPPLMRRGNAVYYVVRPGDTMGSILASFGRNDVIAFQQLVGANPRKTRAISQTRKGRTFWSFARLDPGELLLIPPSLFARGTALSGLGAPTRCDVPPGDRATPEALRHWLDQGGAAGVGADWRFVEPVDFGLPITLRGLDVRQVAAKAGLRPREGFSIAWRFTAPFVETRHDRAGQDAPGGGVLGRLGQRIGVGDTDYGVDADGDGQKDYWGGCKDGWSYSVWQGKCVPDETPPPSSSQAGQPCSYLGPDGTFYSGTYNDDGGCDVTSTTPPAPSGGEPCYADGKYGTTDASGNCIPNADQPAFDCPSGQVWDNDAQACKPIQCPPGWHYNPNTADCSPDQPCEKGYHLDPQKGCIPDGGGPTVPPIPSVPPITPKNPPEVPPPPPGDKPPVPGTGMLDRLKTWLMSPTAKKVGAALAVLAVVYAATGGGKAGGGKRRGSSRRRVSRRRR